MELMWFRWLGSKQASPRLELLLSVLEPPPGRPLIYTGDARRSTESHTGSYSYPGWSLPIPNLQCKFTYQAGLRLQVLNRLQALGLHLLNHLYTTNEVNPAQVGRFTPSSNIPNIRPQIDLNWFMSILHKNLCLQHLLVIGKPPCRHHLWLL